MRDQVLFAVVGLVSIVVGLPLARRIVRPNGWYGLRVPATFADEHVWYEANAVAGRDLMRLGAALLLVALGLPRVAPISRAAYAVTCTIVLAIGSVEGLRWNRHQRWSVHRAVLGRHLHSHGYQRSRFQQICLGCGHRNAASSNFDFRLAHHSEPSDRGTATILRSG